MSGTCIRHVVQSSLAAALLVAPGTSAPRNKHDGRKRVGMQDFDTSPRFHTAARRDTVMLGGRREPWKQRTSLTGKAGDASAVSRFSLNSRTWGGGVWQRESDGFGR